MSKPVSKEAKARWIELSHEAERMGVKKWAEEGSRLIVEHYGSDWEKDWDAAYWIGIGYLEAALGLVETGMVGADEYEEAMKAQELLGL